MRALVELTADVPLDAAGGKARSLARLAAAGLPVPRAFAVTGELFRSLRGGAPPLPARIETRADIVALERAAEALERAPLPADFLVALDEQLDRLEAEDATNDATDDATDGAASARARAFLTRPARFSVRSSFSGEDRRGALGAGVYLSVVGVPRAGVLAAIREVLASALSPGAIAYAHAHGDDDADGGAANGVLVHRFYDGDASGSAAWDPAGGAPPIVEVAAGALTDAARARIDEAARALGARSGPIEIEWVARGGDVTFLQLRGHDPLVAAASAASTWAGAAELGDAETRGGWRWDAAHNPLPLSPAQAGLVALVDRRCRIGIRQCVAGGYLFYAASDEPPARTIAPADAEDELARVEAAVGARLDAWRAEAEAEAEAEADDGAPPLEAALDLFLSVYEPLFGAIQPALRARREGLEALLRENDAASAGAVDIAALMSGVESIASERGRRAARLRRSTSDSERAAALADYVDRFGDESPVWDVAQPTYREDPTPLLAWLAPAATESAGKPASGPASKPDWRRTAAEIEARLPAAARAPFTERLALARAAVALGEEDDFIYARTQAAVRAALLAEGTRLSAQGRLAQAADVFWLPLETTRALARGENEARVATLASLIAAARERHQRALASPPDVDTDMDVAPRGRAAVRGKRASGGRALGRAWVHTHARDADTGTGTDAAARPGPQAIVVAATLLPAELPLLQAAGLIVETGGVLGHVAAQARERGIPAIVGATGACAAIATGDLILLDADAGVVIKIAGRDVDEGDNLYGDDVPG